MKVFITGGTSGIGFELAQKYLAEGHDVAICGRDLSKVTIKIPNLKMYQCDVLDSEQLNNCVAEFAPKGVDLMIASAGIAARDQSNFPDIEKGKQVIETNIIGTMNAIGAVIELMNKNKSGHIVVIASVAGLNGLPGVAAYSASKAALLALCESYAITLKPLGIHVTCLAPGFIDTPMTKANPDKMPFILSLEAATNEIKQAIDKKYVLHVFPKPMAFLMISFSKLPRFAFRYLMNFKAFNYLQK